MTTSSTCDLAGADVEAQPLDFSAIYDAWFGEVVRWVRALGGPDADVEDLAQEVFLVVERRLPAFDGRNVPAWLYRIASRAVKDHQRRAWFRNLVRRRGDLSVEHARATGPSPAESLERAEARRIAWRLLRRLSEKRRTTFILFEVEGYSGEEIARMQGIPEATVWTRLHHARRDFMALVERLQREEAR